ncbi:MAG: hypothetical protein NVS2B3_05610 [Vulcanimicrobiaceae bacterium]
MSSAGTGAHPSKHPEMQERTQAAGIYAIPGAIAGLAGAILIDTYLLVTLAFVAHVTTVTRFYQYVASGAIGPAAYASAGAAYLGFAIHLAVGIAWGIGYAFLAARTREIRDRPLISGAVFGLVVMISMQLVEVIGKIYTLPDTPSFANYAVAHVAFYGIPVAMLVKARLRA